MAIHAIVRTDNLSGTKDGSKLVTVVCPADIDNGNVLAISGLASGEREAYTGSTPAVTTDLGSLVLVAEPEVMYDERLRKLSDFYNLSGAKARAYVLEKGNIFSVTKEALSGATAVSGDVGKIVEVAAATKLKAVASLTSGSTKVGTIIAVEGDFIVIRVA